MTEKIFRVQEHCLRSSYGIEAENWLVTNDNHSVVLNNKAEAHMVANMSNNVINKLNKLHEKNKDLEEARSYYQENFLTMKTERHQLKEENKELKAENEQLKQQIEELEFKLRTIEAYDRTVKEEFSDTVYDFKKKLEKW